MTSQILAKDKKAISSQGDFTFEKLLISGWEDVFKITNEKKGLLAIIALHNTKLGTALGGTRIHFYDSFDDALFDVLRLSEGMTYKAAISEVGFGGGKSVIIKNPKEKTDDLLKAFGEAVNILDGKYICAEDMGCTTEDVMKIRTKTKYVVGLPLDTSSGNPSRFTAWGIFRGIQATFTKLYGSGTIKGKTIAVQGLGSVGELLVEHLFWAGANLIIADIDNEKTKHIAIKFGAKIVSPKEIHKQKCDILAPCAMGATINDETIEELNCKAICGCANNQLLDKRHGEILKEKNILYAPDFVVNAGGLINVAFELDKEGYNPRKSKIKIDNIFSEILSIYEISEKNDISTHEAAIKLAKYKIEYGIGKRKEKLYFHHLDKND
ncbi:MAG: amino acid dehydrogenase [Parachlamydiales bacterium]|nr:amino acid dehydrogenase [Parachlamydiales bacterium]